MSTVDAATDRDAAQDELSLKQLLAKALDEAETAFGSAAPADPHQLQVLLSSALSHLALCASLILHLSILSPNETIDDLTAASLRCLLVPALQGECELQITTSAHDARRDALRRAQSAFRRFTGQVHDYDIVPSEVRKIMAGPSSNGAGAAQRREAKIAQYKAERELKQRVDSLKTRKGKTGVNASDEDEEEIERDLVIAEIRLRYVQAHTHLASIDQELDLLATMPSSSDRTPAPDRTDEDLSWRLDRVTTSALPTSGPILSTQGKVLRPFTILPSTNSFDTRIRLQNGVFGPSHRLPTMTVDEYLEQEAARGNLLSGGGAQGAARQDAEKADRLARQEGDNLEAEEIEERERRRALEWDEYKDSHRRGDGNRLGRG